MESALQSVLDQTYTQWELLAIDDGSTDNSPEILKSYSIRDKRVRIIAHEENKGVPSARNTGIRNSRGKYLLLMDADDINMPNRLEKQIAFMEENPDIDVCGTFARTFGPGQESVLEKPITDKEIKLNLLVGCAFVTPSVIIRKETIFCQKLYFDERWKLVEDYEYWTRSAPYMVYHNIPEILYLYRTAPDSLSRGNPQKMIEATHIVIARSLDSISRYHIELPALNHIDASDEDLETTIRELKALPSNLKQGCFFSPSEVQVATDYLVKMCEQVLVVRQENRMKNNTSV